VIEVCREPRFTGYREVSTYRRGDILHVLAFPDFAVSVDAILP
jgi:hypothetical protein